MILALLSTASSRALGAIIQIAKIPARLLDSQVRKQAAQQAVADLMDLDDRLLTDIGLFRTDLDAIASRLGVNPAQIRL